MVAPVPISIGNNEWIVAAVPYSSPTAAAERDVWTRSGRVSALFGLLLVLLAHISREKNL